jgi:hypothetical protein
VHELAPLRRADRIEQCPLSGGLRVAIFDFELIDTSLEGATNGPRADETARLVRLGDQLRTLVTSSGKLEVIDIAPVRAEAHKASLQACGGCDADFAQKLGAELSITGTVQKVSNLTPPNRRSAASEKFISIKRDGRSATAADLELDDAESGIADQDGLDEQVPFRDWQGMGMVW